MNVSPVPEFGTPEFSRVIDLRHLPPVAVDYCADAAECRRLAARFAIPAIERFCANVDLIAEGAVISATGRIAAAIVQQCAISGEDFPVTIDAPLALRFVPATGAAPSAPDGEVELTADACDEIDYHGLTFDLGEALAQSLALAIDPFAEGPEADRARAEHNLTGTPGGGAFAALAGLTIAAPGADIPAAKD